MAKIAAAAATAALCIAALVAVAVGQQGEVEQQKMLSYLRCGREVEESPLDACRLVLDRHLTGGMRYGVGPFRWGTGLRMRCCQQLQDVSRECRCAAVRRMVRGYEESMAPLGGEEGYGYPCSQAGEGYRGEEGGERQMYPPCRARAKIARVRLTKVRQYAAGLPMMCRLEPQECSIFSGGDQYY